jgi:hypothetical protein
VLCALTIRNLKPGAYEDFRRAWEPETWPEGWVRAYHMRNIESENEVVSFGFFEGTIDELRRTQLEGGHAAQRERIAPFVESIGADGIFEVVEEVVPPGR